LTLLRSKDATEAECIARLEKQYAESRTRLQAKLSAVMNTGEAQQKQIGAYAARYLVLRGHMVQVWKLGIAATGEQLDTMLDQIIAKSKDTRSA
jgi:hypothetical protein